MLEYVYQIYLLAFCFFLLVGSHKGHVVSSFTTQNNFAPVHNCDSHTTTFAGVKIVSLEGYRIFRSIAVESSVLLPNYVRVACVSNPETKCSIGLLYSLHILGGAIVNYAYRHLVKYAFGKCRSLAVLPISTPRKSSTEI